MRFGDSFVFLIPVNKVEDPTTGASFHLNSLDSGYN